jgi:glycosyltransferase involved in cell wall biosynthesis
VRVCLVSQEYPPGDVGGIGTQTQVKALGLAARAHDVTVLTAGGSSSPLRRRDDRELAVYECSAPGGAFAIYKAESYWLGYSWAVFAALRGLADTVGPFDVIDFPDYAAEGFVFQLDRREDDATAVVVHLHGSLSMFAEQIGWPEPHEPLYRVGGFMEDLSIESADSLIAASSSIAALAAGRYDVPLERIEVVDGAVDTETFRPIERRDEGAHGMTLLFVGDVEASKGADTVLDAFIKLAGRHPLLALVIAGAIGPETAEAMRSRTADVGLAERVRILGFVEHEQLPALYRSADVFAAPSDYEGGLGMVYLEAMACGLPVVALAAGGAAEAIEHEVTGILMSRGDVEETAAAVERLLGDRQLRVRMGRAGRVRVCERFGVSLYAARVAEAYERAIERRRSSLAVW